MPKLRAFVLLKKRDELQIFVRSHKGSTFARCKRVVADTRRRRFAMRHDDGQLLAISSGDFLSWRRDGRITGLSRRRKTGTMKLPSTSCVFLVADSGREDVEVGGEDDAIALFWRRRARLFVHEIVNERA